MHYCVLTACSCIHTCMYMLTCTHACIHGAWQRGEPKLPRATKSRPNPWDSGMSMWRFSSGGRKTQNTENLRCLAGQFLDLQRLRSCVFGLVECRSQVGDNIKKSTPHKSTCDAVGRRNKIGTARPLTVPTHRQRSSCDTPSRKGNALNLRRSSLYEIAKQAVF